MIVALFYNGPLTGEFRALESAQPIFRVPMPPKPLPFAFAESTPPHELLTIRVGSYRRDLHPRPPHCWPNQQTPVYWYLWEGVEGEG